MAFCQSRAQVDRATSLWLKPLKPVQPFGGTETWLLHFERDQLPNCALRFVPSHCSTAGMLVID